MKQTALSQKHIDLGAKMVEFAGYAMPVQYSGVNEEHEIVRNGVGVFDVSHMGEFMLRGTGALDLIQKISSNDAEKLFDGKAQYACIPNETGGIIDDFLTYRISKDEYLLVVNASNIEKDWNWLVKNNTFDCEMENISDQTSLLAVQGPKAAEAIQDLTDIDLDLMPYYTHQTCTFAGIENVLVSTTGYTGSGGFEIYFPNESANQIWEAIFNSGKNCGIKPIGLAARDTLRLEMGFCLYGNDIDDNTSPLEAGLGWVTKFTKQFTNANNLLAEKENGIKNRLVGFELLDRGIPRHGYAIIDVNGKEIGKVTSGTMGPSVQKAIGLGYVPHSLSAIGTEILIQVRNKQLKAKVVKLPFYKAN
ncbi:glycine cleavage system aminomethyltransferase GcvT [Flavobacteriales bacterium]|nr:glycine cleavage system aminomethyltransferase GcvT [Flavobacteriales bacterium]